MQKFKLLALSLMTLTLVACGGGSSSSSESSGKPSTKPDNNNSTPPASNTAKITAACAESNGGVTVTKAGCVFNLGANAQTAICTGTSIKMLSGKDLTLQQVENGGSTFSAGGSLTLNGKKLSCAS